MKVRLHYGKGRYRRLDLLLVLLMILLGQPITTTLGEYYACLKSTKGVEDERMKEVEALKKRSFQQALLENREFNRLTKWEGAHPSEQADPQRGGQPCMNRWATNFQYLNVRRIGCVFLEKLSSSKTTIIIKSAPLKNFITFRPHARPFSFTRITVIIFPPPLRLILAELSPICFVRRFSLLGARVGGWGVSAVLGYWQAGGELIFHGKPVIYPVGNV